MLNYCAVIPARNEAARLAQTLRALRTRRDVSTIIVVDDASTDATSQIARDEGANVVKRLDNRGGKGAALQAGIAVASADTDVFLFLDADLGDSATECVKLIGPIERGEADMTIGMLPPDPALVAAGETGGGMGLVVGFARNALRRQSGLEFQQPLAGQRAVRREIIDRLGGKLPKGFGVEVGLTLFAVKNDFRVLEVETMFRHRVTGHDWRARLHRARQLVDVAAALR